MGNGRVRQERLTIAILGGFALLAGVARVSAQEPAPPQVPPPADNRPETDEISDRLGKMEEMNRKILAEIQKLAKENQDLNKVNKDLSKQNEDLSHRYSDLSKKIEGLEKAREAKPGSSGGESAKSGTPAPGGGGARSGDAGLEGSAVSPGRGSAPGAQVVGNRQLGKLKLKADYNYDTDGFQFTTDDDELQLKIRAMSQADSRIYQQSNQDPVTSGFYVPRTRFYFSGRVTRPIEYQVSFQRGYSSLDLLNAYLNFHYDDRLQIRFGRFKTPFTYEYYKYHVWQLLAPERSLFNVNFQGNRQVGLMGWGELFENRMEYAVGIFDGPRKSYEDFNGPKDVMAFLNFRPFEQTDSFLKKLNVGGSVDFGNQNNPLNPAVLRTSLNESSAAINSTNAANLASVPFLAFNNNVREQGDRALWELHMAYYYRGLSLLGAWDGGFSDYAITGKSSRPVHLPVGGFFVQAAYLLTGETVTDATLIDPIRRFDLRAGQFGLGAFQVTARYSELNVGRQVFTQGLADPNLWTNRADMVDVGLNWYLNKWVKIYFDWEHAVFAQPVYYRPGPALQKTSDLFWLRLQLYF